MLAFKNNIFTATALFLIIFSTIADGKICKSIDIRNHVQNLNKLKDCTEIAGDLFIVLLQNTKSESDYDPYVFPDLQKVSGYVLLFKLKHFTSLGKLLPNLRMIRGLTLLKNYALIIYDVPRMQEIGTSKLAYIARGYVKIGKTPLMCYVDTIYWRKIGPDIFVHYQKYNQDCPQCPAACNGYCWNQDQCQVFTDNCHMECLGCTKNNSNAHCEVCKNYKDGDICVAECPPDKYTLQITGICVSREECLARNALESNQMLQNNRKTWFIHNGECRSDCPMDTVYNRVSKTCEQCGRECVKYCRGGQIVSHTSIDMRGCTHINGSLSILNLESKEQRDGLYANLKSLRYIRDYLLIARNEVIEDLLFLPELAVIGGATLYANKSLLVYGNRNLKKLWDLNSDVTLRIRNGSIGFHDNEYLCMTEIERFAKKSGIKYNDTDVSKNSNGVYCYENIDKEFQVNVTEVNTDNVTLVWERKYGDNELYYTVHYSVFNLTKDERKRQDFCSSTGWDTLSTANNSVQLTKLKVFTTYYFYIETYLKNTTNKKSLTKSFQTLPDDPESPSSFSAHPVDHNSIRLVWTRPYHTNGNLSKYIITIYPIKDDLNIADKRDYCESPFSEAGTEVDQNDDFSMGPNGKLKLGYQDWSEMYDLGPPELTQPDPPCGPTNEEINIRLENNIWLFLCDKNSKSKFGVDFCKNYYYEDVSYASDNNQMQKRSEEETSALHKNSGGFITEVVGANTTNHMLTNLEQFSLYVFYIEACNENYGGRKLCSSVLQASARTLKNPHADDVPDFSVKAINKFDLLITWSEPKNPNGFILAYNIFYKRHLQHSKNQTECITHPKFLRERKLILRNLSPGGYYLTIQAISLAGPGNFSPMKYIELSDSGANPLWFIVAIGFVVTVGAIALLIYYRVKRRRMMDSIHLIRTINPDYTSLSYTTDEWELERDDVHMERLIGQGTFGRVYIGRIISQNRECAIKTVIETASVEEKIKFLAEASSMKLFTESNHVLKLYGVVSKSQPPLVAMEYMGNEDLKKYLTNLNMSSQSISSNEIYRMAIEIADGLAYLSNKKYVHRDLAARNCMVSHDKTVKIGDFGLTRDIYQSDYYKKGIGNALLPVRWMAPEAIADGVYTYDSDIWSFGVVLWEIVTLAAQPYQGLTNEEVTSFVTSKGTLCRPPECPNLLWEIMRKCWDWYPSKRPTCFEVVEKLQDHVGENFKLLSFYHSSKGQEYLLRNGNVRTQNPPALPTGRYRYRIFDEATENDPLRITEEPNQDNDTNFASPSNTQRTHRLSRKLL